MNAVDRDQALHNLYLAEALMNEPLFASAKVGRQETFFHAQWTFMLGDFTKCRAFCEDCINHLVAAYGASCTTVGQMLIAQKRATEVVRLYSGMSTEELIANNNTAYQQLLRK